MGPGGTERFREGLIGQPSRYVSFHLVNTRSVSQTTLASNLALPCIVLVSGGREVAETREELIGHSDLLLQRAASFDRDGLDLVQLLPCFERCVGLGDIVGDVEQLALTVKIDEIASLGLGSCAFMHED